MRRRFALLIACRRLLRRGVGADHSALPTRTACHPSPTTSVPFTYVGGDGSVLDRPEQRRASTRSQLVDVFARNNARARCRPGLVEPRRCRRRAGRLQLALGRRSDRAAREHPDRATVSRLSFAVDRARPQGGVQASASSGATIPSSVLARGFGNGRAAGHQLHDDVAQVGSSDDIGTYRTGSRAATIDTLFEQALRNGIRRAVRARVRAACDARAWRCEYAGRRWRARDDVLARSRHATWPAWLGLSALAEHVARSGAAGEGDDDRVSVFLRYEFARHTVARSRRPRASKRIRPGISRSLARPSSGHPRTVETIATCARGPCPSRRVRASTPITFRSPRPTARARHRKASRSRSMRLPMTATPMATRWW